jgi:hypothetical protein
MPSVSIRRNAASAGVDQTRGETLPGEDRAHGTFAGAEAYGCLPSDMNAIVGRGTELDAIDHFLRPEDFEPNDVGSPGAQRLRRTQCEFWWGVYDEMVALPEDHAPAANHD